MAATAKGTGPIPSRPGSIYTELLETVLAEQESSVPRLSAAEALAQVIRCRRNAVRRGSTVNEKDRATLALADQVAYDSALIAYTRRLGIECDPHLFADPGLERQRIERTLEGRGIILTPSGTGSTSR
jgi:hypothetical protein